MCTCVEAFEQGNKQDAERLLPQIGQLANIWTTTYMSSVLGVWWYNKYMYASLVNQVSLLHLAAHHGWMDIVIDLITKYKCDTNCKDSRGHTPLHYAICNNHLEVVRYFINEQHCDPMARNILGNTPLHYACNHSHIDIVKYLLSTGKVDPLAKNNNGESPLMYKYYNQNYTLLHLAVTHGWGGYRH